MRQREKQEHLTLLRLSRRYQNVLLAGSLLLLLACLALTQHNYQAHKRQLLGDLASDVDEYRYSASAAGKLAENHVARLKRRALDHYESRPAFDTQPFRQLREPVMNDGNVDGYALAEPGDSRVRVFTPQVFTKAEYFESGGSDSELDKVFALTQGMREGHESNPGLVWSYFFSANRNLVAIYPWIDVSNLMAAQDYPSVRSAIDDYFTYEIVVNSEPALNPDGTPHWSEPYDDAGGTGLMVSHGAPIHHDGQYIGMVGTDILLEVFQDFVSRIHLDSGRLWLVSQGGQVIADSSISGNPEQLTALHTVAPWLKEDDLQEALRDHGGKFRNVDGHYLLARPVVDTPWTLLYVVHESGLRWLILPRLSPYLAIVLLIITSFFGALWMLRRLFISPAIALAGYIHDSVDKEDPPQPRLPQLWQPLAHIVETVFRKSRLQQHLLEESRRLKVGIIEAAPVCIISANSACEIIEFNPEAERCFGHRAEDVLGRHMTDILVPVQLREAHNQGFSRFCRTLQGTLIGRRLELSALRADGTEFPIEINLVTSRHGEELVITAFIVDLAERKQAELELRRQRDLLHQSEKLNAMGSLLANVAHELNNPLAVVVGRSIMLEDQMEDSGSRSSVTRIREAAERCVRIVRTFLSMARQREQEQRPMQVNEVLMMAIEIQRHALQTSGIELTLKLDSDLPIVQASSDQLHQVFLNLIINAQQALAECLGSRRLHICSHQQAQQIHIVVEDNGPGVPEEIRSRIFEPYFTTKPMGVGTGVGLSVCLGIVKAHGGDITVGDSPLGGARFQIILPITESAQSFERPEPRAQPSELDSQTRILVVDDEPEISSMLGDILAGDAARVDFADNGWAALDLLAEHHYDAILADLRMPGLDGAALFGKIVEQYPELASRVIFITGDALSPGMAKFLSELDAPVIEKPFVPADVKQCLAELLMQHQAET
jgi:PAS domain S-box-containing protein